MHSSGNNSKKNNTTTATKAEAEEEEERERERRNGEMDDLFVGTSVLGGVTTIFNIVHTFHSLSAC